MVCHLWIFSVNVLSFLSLELKLLRQKSAKKEVKSKRDWI